MKKTASAFGLMITLYLLTACQTSNPTSIPAPSNIPGQTQTPSKIPFVAAGSDVTVSLPVGDPERGQQVAGARDCVNCHANGIGPVWVASEGLPGLGDRAAERILQSDYTGTALTAEQYLFESIALPNVYIVEGYPKGLMPDRFGDLVSAQDMADIIAYLLTYR